MSVQRRRRRRMRTQSRRNAWTVLEAMGCVFFPLLFWIVVFLIFAVK